MSNPTGSAVVVVDLVQDYFKSVLWPDSQLPGTEDVLSTNVNRLCRAARAASVPVIWVRQEFQPDLSDAFPHMIAANRRYAISGTSGCQLLEQLDTAPDDIDVVKTRFSAFFETDLDRHLGNHDVRTVYLAGITTAWCIRTTAVDAYQRGYGVRLVADCLAGFTHADHQNSLREMDGYIARTIQSHEAFAQ